MNNKKFFKDEITIYNTLDEGETYTKLHFDGINLPKVYFRHNKKTNLIDKRT